MLEKTSVQKHHRENACALVAIWLQKASGNLWGEPIFVKMFSLLGCACQNFAVDCSFAGGMRIKADYRCSQSNYGILAVALDEGFVYPYHWGSLKYWYRNRVGFQNIIMHFGDKLPIRAGRKRWLSGIYACACQIPLHVIISPPYSCI